MYLLKQNNWVMFPIDLHYYIRDVFLWREIWPMMN